MYWRDALLESSVRYSHCGLLPHVMLEENDVVLLVLSQTGKSCLLTTVFGGYPDGTRLYGERALCVSIEDVDGVLQQYQLPLTGWVV